MGPDGSVCSKMVLKRIYYTGAMSWVYSFLANSIIKLIAFALALKPKDSLAQDSLLHTHTQTPGRK